MITLSFCGSVSGVFACLLGGMGLHSFRVNEKLKIIKEEEEEEEEEETNNPGPAYLTLVKAAFRSWLKIECARGKNARQCYEILQDVCGENALPYRTVARWVKAFNEGRQNVTDMPRSGHPTVSEENVQNVNALVLADRNSTIRQLANDTRLAPSTVLKILKKHLQMPFIASAYGAIDFVKSFHTFHGDKIELYQLSEALQEWSDLNDNLSPTASLEIQNQWDLINITRIHNSLYYAQVFVAHPPSCKLMKNILPDPDSMSTGTTGREPLPTGMLTGLERAGRDPDPTPTSTASISRIGDPISQALGGAKHAVTLRGIPPPGSPSSEEDCVRPRVLIEGFR
ncbi:hypothetical protein C0J52_11883 [Blattella germanica]|nr:hypothetical protein C0J52_11883 [Blattella germanica]